MKQSVSALAIFLCATFLGYITILNHQIMLEDLDCIYTRPFFGEIEICKDKKGSPFTGVAYTYSIISTHIHGHKNTAEVIKVEIPFKNGKIDGIRKAYETVYSITEKLSITGKLREETPYKNNKVNGTQKEYYKNGKLKRETPAKDNNKDGIEKEYHENGKLKRETPYKDGNKDGIEKEYHENGTLAREVLYKNGHEDGLEKFYDKTGRLRKEIPFKDGGLAGEAKVYDETPIKAN